MGAAIVRDLRPTISTPLLPIVREPKRVQTRPYQRIPTRQGSSPAPPAVRDVLFAATGRMAYLTAVAADLLNHTPSELTVRLGSAPVDACRRTRQSPTAHLRRPR